MSIHTHTTTNFPSPLSSTATSCFPLRLLRLIFTYLALTTTGVRQRAPACLLANEVCQRLEGLTGPIGSDRVALDNGTTDGGMEEIRDESIGFGVGFGVAGG